MSNYRINATFEKALYDWVVRVLGSTHTVIWDKQTVYGSTKAQRPSLPFVALNISSGPSRVGFANIKYKTTDTYTKTINYRFSLSVNIYSRNGHLESAQSLIDSLEGEDQKLILRTAGLAYWPINTDIRDLSEILETSYEFRSNCEFTFSYSSVKDISVTEIHSVSITDNDTGKSQTITIEEP